mmetsp:Transcript_44904/g.88601  ORF Transcript_44904/g.88601 Transcript_44904/m.88601 type:complete len:158 (-) Transcript_44904:190-663(-)
MKSNLPPRRLSSALPRAWHGQLWTHRQMLLHGLKGNHLCAVVAGHSLKRTALPVLNNVCTAALLATPLERTNRLGLFTDVKVFLQFLLRPNELTAVLEIQAFPSDSLNHAANAKMCGFHLCDGTSAVWTRLAMVQDFLETGTAIDVPSRAIRLHRIV